MSKQDLLFVALRVYGVFLIVQAAAGLTQIPGMFEGWAYDRALNQLWMLGPTVVYAVCGLVLALRTERVCALLPIEKAPEPRVGGEAGS